MAVQSKFPVSYLELRQTRKKTGRVGELVIFGVADTHALAHELESLFPTWKKKITKLAEKELYFGETLEGPRWILIRRRPSGPFSHESKLEETDQSWFRAQAGPILSAAQSLELDHLDIEFRGTNSEMELGFLVGLELGAYSYKGILQKKVFDQLPTFSVRKTQGEWDSSVLKAASHEGQALNLARHLVNLPPNLLHPQSFAQFIKTYIPKSAKLKIQVWDHRRLAKEKMGLHLGVGQGAQSPPCLVHISYRGGGRKKPTAFVGKGITFDTGGLDLKPSSAMRLMKKDMGGAAAVAGLALYVALSRPQLNFDFYLGLAENSVDANGFRPSDVLTARNGMTVEVHNTDAEGRLVLADVLDVAVTQKGPNEPAEVIDVATLTGAIKVGLGNEIAGLFSNHDALADELEKAGSSSGDLNWRMPLYSKYAANFSTPFADLVNATDSPGGAITAALFLEKFVRNKPWAHLDIYAWTEKATGSLQAAGGNAQGLYCLIEFVKNKNS